MPNSPDEITFRTIGPVTVGAASSVDTQGIPLLEIKPRGNFSVTIVVTGTGTATIDYLQAFHVGSTLILPTADSQIALNLAAGTYTYPLSTNVIGVLGFRIDNAHVSNSVVVNIEVAIQ